MSATFDFDQDYGVFQEFVDNCNLKQLNQCKTFVEKKIEKIEIINDKRMRDYVAGLKNFDLEDQQKIRKLMDNPDSEDSPKSRSQKPQGAKPSGFIEVEINSTQYWVPQLIDPDNDDFFAAGSPRNKSWVGDLKTEEHKQDRRAKYGAATVLRQYPEKLKMLAKKEAVYRKEGEIFVKVSAEEV